MSKTALPGGMEHNGAWKSSRRPGVVHQEKKKKMWDEVQKCLRLFSQWLNWRLMRREIPHLERNRWENWQLGKMCECVFVICECSTLSALPVLLPRLSSGHTKLSLTSLWFMLRFFSPAASFAVWSIRVLLFCAVLAWWLLHCERIFTNPFWEQSEFIRVVWTINTTGPGKPNRSCPSPRRPLSGSVDEFHFGGEEGVFVTFQTIKISPCAGEIFFLLNEKQP